jgi:hypothetical protein
MKDFPKGHTALSDDDRPIKSINAKGDMQAWFRIGVGGCSRIVAYDESGHMANIPWIAVVCGDEIICRVPADHVSIHY